MEVNMMVRAAIFMVSPHDFRAGKCSCCKGPALLKYCDCVTGEMYGDCCFGYLIKSEAFLLNAGASIGIRPPDKGDNLK